MPRNCLSLAIRVGCEINGIGGFRAFFKFLYNIRFVFHIDILRFKIMLHVNAEF